MELKKVTYKAAWWNGPREVTGYAVNSPTGVRYAVRKRDCSYTSWTADDWDSGASLGSRVGYARRRSELIAEVERQLPKLVRSGEYAKYQAMFLNTLRAQKAFEGALS